jgi:hypothetical protein
MSQEIGHSATFLKLFSAFCGDVSYEKSEGELSKEKEKGKRVQIPKQATSLCWNLGGVSANRVTQPKVEQ